MACTHEHSLELYITLAYGGLVNVTMRHMFALASLQISLGSLAGNNVECTMIERNMVALELIFVIFLK